MLTDGRRERAAVDVEIQLTFGHRHRHRGTPFDGSRLARYTLASHRKYLRLVPAALGEQAGVIGAGLQAWHALREDAGR